MATIAAALRQGVIDAYELPDWERRTPIRSLFCASSFFDHVDADERLLDEGMAIGGRVLLEHLEQMFCEFRCAKRPSASELKRLMPTRKRVWKMHPPGLRIYGWCPEPQQFVAVNYALEIETKADRLLNDAKRDDVLDFVRRHKLESTMKSGDYLALFPAQD